ncbi:MAG TPA: alanine racemase [Streptosporangiaceae bacterium]|nr:alanine racemase [Streptosporangiaceae bacterium]
MKIVTAEDLRTRPFEPSDKAFGPLAGQTPAGLATARSDLDAAGLSFPVLSLRSSALTSNAQAMAAYCAAHGVVLAPHGKTGMSPELAQLQLDHGAWAITVATMNQLRTYSHFGFDRLLLANQMTDPADLRWLAERPQLEAYFYVDDPSFITSCAISPAHPLPVLVEIGFQGGRTGCRTDEEAVEVAKAVAASDAFRLAGVAAYEGTMHGNDAVERAAEFCRRLRRLADRLRGFASGPEDFIVTAGGSTYFDVVTNELTAGDRSGLRIVLRSGAYLYHDHGIYARSTPAARAGVNVPFPTPGGGERHIHTAGAAPLPRFTPAIELWARVQSRPEPGLALLGFGRRDAGTDAGLPVPLDLGDGAEITDLNDQHAYLHLSPQESLAPGDIVRLGISHPCTTLDKWQLIPLLDDDTRITGVVHAFW